MKLHRLLPGFLLALLPLSAPAAELVHLDPQGVVRWNTDDREVALFGANYCLPSACDYRAAGYVGADRKKLVEQDMAHFARMGWDAMRLCLWGDWENSDHAGNLIVNDHLDVMDYAIAEAKKRGVYILFTPITTYGSWWPDGKATDPNPGFSNYFKKAVLGSDPAAIAAQVNYLRQILNHVNPYTGVALKDEPQILFVEMINEPHHHADDVAGSVAYINALAAAVRSTGCTKLLFHNASQDFKIVPAILASTVRGVTFAWYPTGLNAGHTLAGSYLRSVDDFTPMHRADLKPAAKIVYEFDAPDMNSGYMYPAMARAFRGVGAQFATMFAYDMLATAPYNLGWQTHFLNLVYSPKKAMSAVIAAEVMRRIPRETNYGAYPANTRFGPFRVSAEEDSSELVTDDTFLHANTTRTAPPAPAKLTRIAGTGSSPLVSYEGNGTYFLDKLADGVWRLEVYPDALTVADPFAHHLDYQNLAIRIVSREWPMTVRLPGLGEKFTVTGIDAGNARHAEASSGTFPVAPGVYLLSKEKNVERAKLPARIGHTGLTEFICPPAPVLPPQIVPAIPAVYTTNIDTVVAAEVASADLPAEVVLHVRSPGSTGFKEFSLSRERAYRYAFTIPANELPANGVEYYLTVATKDGETRFPARAGEILAARAAAPETPLVLFDAGTDIPALAYTRVGDNVRRGVFKALPATATEPAALRLMLPLSLDQTLDDYTASLAVKPRIAERRAHLTDTATLRVKARASTEGRAIHLTFVETDGTSWGVSLPLTAGWQEFKVALADLTPTRGVKLPLGYPERWNYWIEPAAGRTGPDDQLNLAALEHVQISLHPDAPALPGAPDASIDIASIDLRFP